MMGSRQDEGRRRRHPPPPLPRDRPWKTPRASSE